MKRIYKYLLCLVFLLPGLAVAQETESDFSREAVTDTTFSEDDIVEISDINGSHFCPILGVGITSHKDFTFGLTLAYMQQFGGYISAQVNNFDFEKSSKFVNSDGVADNGQKAFLTGDSKVSRLSLVGGVTYVVVPDLIAYLGGGYGYRRLLYETCDGAYLKEHDNTVEGYEVDFGVIANFNNFLVKLGCNTIKFKSAELRAGLGWRF
ncbi:MAG: hypothetical protein MJZ19_07550 [Paludibacteraceae bacterium]|nr:hypothetical protein [Paludibacteraceae bacterium]